MFLIIMFLKIHYQNSVKKIKLTEEHRDTEKLISFLSSLFKIAPETVRVSFKDVEDDLIQIEDNHDLDYFFE